MKYIINYLSKLFKDIKSVSKVLYYFIMAAIFLLLINAGFALMNTQSTVAFIIGSALVLTVISFTVIRFFKQKTQ